MSTSSSDAASTHHEALPPSEVPLYAIWRAVRAQAWQAYRMLPLTGQPQDDDLQIYQGIAMHLHALSAGMSLAEKEMGTPLIDVVADLSTRSGELASGTAENPLALRNVLRTALHGLCVHAVLEAKKLATPATSL